MSKRIFPALVIAFVAVVGVAPWIGRFLDQSSGSQGKQAVRPFGIDKRIEWTSSRINGSPDPPHPYRIVRAFPHLVFRNPLLMARAPGVDRFFVAEQAGKIFSFRKNPDCPKADLFIDVAAELKSWDAKKVRGVGAVYGLAFHPQFARNRFCYICYVLDGHRGEQLPDGTRVSRFRVTRTDPPRCDPASEKIMITWLAGGHNGGDLHFGPDGFLYISTGDAASPNPPDALDTGQDLSDLLSAILRIDVDHAGKGKAYAIPRDNPFVKTPGARPEIWAYGFRNPWRMSFDRQTGDLWVGDVGWELWEMIYKIQKGGNYGWSVMEGRQPVRPDSKRGPTPILPPALDFPHTEAASITGGYVYRGKRLKELRGAYVCGDWVTRKLWGTRFEGDKIVWHKELAQGPQRVVAFGEDDDGELYFLNYDEKGTIHQLMPNEAAGRPQPPFPRKLSETGLFSNVHEQIPAAGVLPFSIRAGQWVDFARAERYLGLPGRSLARIYDRPIPADGFFSGQVFFPKDGVLAKTLSMEMERGRPKSRKYLETQILHFDGLAWHGYSYQWNDEQTDAVLVPAAGLDSTFTVVDPQAPGGKRKQTWHFPSRTECLTCHNPWTGYTIAFSPLQLNKAHRYGDVLADQVGTMQHIGLVDLRHREDSGKDRTLAQWPKNHLVDPYADGDLDARARSYLHVNCSHCHQFGAGGTSDLELRFTISLKECKIVDVKPVQGAFDIPDAKILAPGDPYRSILYYRMAKLGGGHMPHIGSSIIDERGLRLIHDWIVHLGKGKKTPAPIDLATVVKGDMGARAEAIRRLLSQPASAIQLARAYEDGRLPSDVRGKVLAEAQTRPPQIRDLFERFLPDEKRVKRLGTNIQPEQLLARKGDPARGRSVFFNAALSQCSNCHRVGAAGSTLGPDLSQIGKKYSRAQILESILQPSKIIEPQYLTQVIETRDGKIHTGLLAEKNGREVVLKNAGDKIERIPVGDITASATQQISIMPEALLRELTAEQAVDLLEFLASLK